jgi:hypothetical protein
MRKAIIATFLATLLGLGSPATAAVVTTTATGCNGGDCPSIPVTLQAFDGSLGTLQGVTITVSVDAITAYGINFQTWASDPYQTAGSAHLAYQGPFQFSLNGQTYALQIAGQQDVSFTIANIGFPSGEFHATGSNSFTVDSSLLGLFLAGAANCGTFVCAIGLTPAPAIGTIVQSADNVSFNPFQSGVITSYTVNYVYAAAVPELRTWAMMLLGLLAVGITSRGSRKQSSGDSSRHEAL